VKKLAILLAAACLLLSGCSSLGGTNGVNVVIGNGQVLQIAAADRAAPIALSGTSLTGDAIDATSYLGKPLVINVWWSACVPCRTEMPMLVELEKERRGKVGFLGIDVRDFGTDVPLAFARDKGVDFPTIFDPNGKALLAFSGKVSPRSVPTTLVIDTQGRVAAVISGPIPSKLTLTEVLDQVGREDG
jgi:thiol-disulfide isomerase/thioredoxin